MNEEIKKEEQKNFDVERLTKTQQALERIAMYFEQLNAGDYLFLSQRPLRMLFLSFGSGVARGFGMAVGMTFLFGIIIYLLKGMVDVPLIGQYLGKLVTEINKYKAIK